MIAHSPAKAKARQRERYYTRLNLFGQFHPTFSRRSLEVLNGVVVWYMYTIRVQKEKKNYKDRPLALCYLGNEFPVGCVCLTLRFSFHRVTTTTSTIQYTYRGSIGEAMKVRKKKRVASVCVFEQRALQNFTPFSRLKRSRDGRPTERWINSSRPREFRLTRGENEEERERDSTEQSEGERSKTYNASNAIKVDWTVQSFSSESHQLGSFNDESYQLLFCLSIYVQRKRCTHRSELK